MGRFEFYIIIGILLFLVFYSKHENNKRFLAIEKPRVEDAQYQKWKEKKTSAAYAKVFRVNKATRGRIAYNEFNEPVLVLIIDDDTGKAYVLR